MIKNLVQNLVIRAAVISALLAPTAFAENSPQLQKGLETIKSMTGCYLVDYSYTETESLKEGYVRDNRVYDVNGKRSVKEWIVADEITPTRIRLQHILFGVGLDGQLQEGSILKHQVEDWEYSAPFLYNFTGPAHWSVVDLKSTPDLWTRRITNLDDGLRYQCAATWNTTTANPEWSCSDYAPIPGRETRDMGRKDYNALDRSTRVIFYGNSWLERQNNVKTIDQNGTRTPLARELGKTWYVRLPDTECSAAQEFAKPRQAFWTLLRQAWDEVLSGDAPFVEKTLAQGEAPRYAKMFAIEEQYMSQNLNDEKIRTSAKQDIVNTINAYRVK